jgi:hypothetical protein
VTRGKDFPFKERSAIRKAKMWNSCSVFQGRREEISRDGLGSVLFIVSKIVEE